MSGLSEANIQAEFYRAVKNLIESGKGRFDSVDFTRVSREHRVDGGFADLVIFGKDKGIEIPFIVIETKRSNSDPWDTNVINQAQSYASNLGAPYFVTTNGVDLISFKTFETGRSLPERRVKPYNIGLRITEEAVAGILGDLTRIHLGVGRWSELDEVFLKRLNTFHSIIVPHVQTSLKSTLFDDKDFNNRYDEWLKSQFLEIGEETNQHIASQVAYILMNRVLFYKTLEAHRTKLPQLRKIDYSSGGDFTVKLREYFKKVLDINYKSIFEEGLLDKIPIIIPLAEILNSFIEELDTYNLSKIQSDVIGRVYEDLIPVGERHRLGQYYTPPPIVDLIVEMTVENPNDTVLDPGCGSGGFLVKSYNKLKELKRKENPLRQPEELHEDVLEQLWGIDINQFPAHLASINLAVRNLDVLSRNIQVVVSDFFNVNPTFIRDKDGRTTIFGLAKTTSLSGTDLGKLPHEGFDVIVTNPPYTRQEEMEYKDRIRDVALTYSDGSKIDLGAQSGIYAYFFTHSAKFLKNGGRMGYITSDTWLDVGFGVDLKRFFIEHFKMESIIWYDVRAFEKPLVGTCIVILEKSEGLSSEDREKNIVKFVRIKKSMPIQDIVKTIEDITSNFESDAMGIMCVKQERLKPEEKWGKYLRAPIIYYKIVQHPKMTRLGDVAEIRRGFTTGANEFFYLDDEKVKLWAIEREYLGPVVTSPKDVKMEIRPEDVSEWVLMVHEPEDILKKRNTNVLKYIEHGENIEIRIKGGVRGGTTVKGYQNLSTVKSRKNWYDLGKREPAPILRYRRVWERCAFPLNTAKAYANDSFYEIYPKSKEEHIVLAGMLNSSITALLSELHGRFYGGGVLELEVYEAKELPVIDPSKLSRNERKKIEEAFIELCKAQRKGDSKLEDDAVRRLDKVVFDILGLTEDEMKQVYDGLESLRRMRLQRKDVKVLVETEEGWKPPERHKAREREEKEPSKRLDMWV